MLVSTADQRHTIAGWSMTTLRRGGGFMEVGLLPFDCRSRNSLRFRKILLALAHRVASISTSLDGIFAHDLQGFAR